MSDNDPAADTIPRDDAKAWLSISWISLYRPTKGDEAPLG
jgi:hypothetical protein